MILLWLTLAAIESVLVFAPWQWSGLTRGLSGE
jgi:hypothetical protein